MSPTSELQSLLATLPHLGGAAICSADGAVAAVAYNELVFPDWPAEVFPVFQQVFQAIQQAGLECRQQRWVLRDGVVWAFGGPSACCILLLQHDLTPELVQALQSLLTPEAP